VSAVHIYILSKLDQCWDLGRVRCTGLDEFFMPPFPNVSIRIPIRYWYHNRRLDYANIPRIST